jgi:pentapeptide repeat protein
MNDVPRAPAPTPAAGAFNAAGWREQLLALNSWARGLTIDETDGAFAAARQEATLARHAEGKEAWNRWADEMQALRKVLEDAGGWSAEPPYLGFPLVGNNADSRFWLRLAAHVFSRDASTHTFDREARFAEFRFVADARFEGASFAADASFQRASFKGATFMSNAGFEGRVDFSQSTFNGPVILDRSVFRAGASFEAIGSEAAFSLADADFHHVPSFIGAAFKGTLRLDNVATPKYPWLGWTPDRNASAHFRELKRRAVEAQDRDRELEFFAQEIRTARFHASAVVPRWETGAKEPGARHRLTWARVALPDRVPRFWSWRFWFGLAYGTCSNFGRSFIRPLAFWLLLLLGFAVFYLGQHESLHGARNKPDGKLARAAAYVTTARTAWHSPPECTASNARLLAGTNAVREALFLSASNGLVLFNLSRGDASRRTYGCLYGFEHSGPQAPPIIPYRVAVASTLQTLMSTVLIFCSCSPCVTCYGSSDLAGGRMGPTCAETTFVASARAFHCRHSGGGRSPDHLAALAVRWCRTRRIWRRPTSSPRSRGRRCLGHSAGRS